MQSALPNLLSFIVSDNALLFLVIAGGLIIFGMIFILSHLRKVKQDIRRRVIADPGQIGATALGSRQRVKNSLLGVAENLSHASGAPGAESVQYKQLQFKLIQAGYFDSSAVPVFFGIRIASGAAFVVVTLAALFFLDWASDLQNTVFVAVLALCLGYFFPSIVLNRRLEKLKMEHRAAFPDFMDLMVVCSQAGMSMEASMKRISDELTLSYPSLARHLELATIELRSGRGLSKAVEAFGKRLGIEEASSFSTLLTQSEELGSSLTQSLRAYSDDMRNKRLMKAEEKAFALPAKLVIPLTLFVFPTLLVVILLPIVVSVSRTG